MLDRSELQQQAQTILEQLASLPFDNCQPLSREFIDRLDPNDVRIAAVVLGWNLWQQALDLEASILQPSRPRHNIQIRQEE